MKSDELEVLRIVHESDMLALQQTDAVLTRCRAERDALAGVVTGQRSQIETLRRENETLRAHASQRVLDTLTQRQGDAMTDISATGCRRNWWTLYLVKPLRLGNETYKRRIGMRNWAHRYALRRGWQVVWTDGIDIQRLHVVTVSFGKHIETLTDYSGGDFTPRAALTPAAEPAPAPVEPQENFFDAVRNDPDMKPEYKSKWLALEPPVSP